MSFVVVVIAKQLRCAHAALGVQSLYKTRAPSHGILVAGALASVVSFRAAAVAAVVAERDGRICARGAAGLGFGKRLSEGGRGN